MTKFLLCVVLLPIALPILIMGCGAAMMFLMAVPGQLWLLFGVIGAVLGGAMVWAGQD